MKTNNIQIPEEKKELFDSLCMAAIRNDRTLLVSDVGSEMIITEGYCQYLTKKIGNKIIKVKIC